AHTAPLSLHDALPIFRTQTPVGYLIQIISNLHLHIITYILIFLNTAEQFVKVIVIRGMKQIPHHAKHTMSTLCKEIDFLACLQRSEEHTSELQSRFDL